MIEQAYNIAAVKDNKDLLYHLIVAVSKKRLD